MDTHNSGHPLAAGRAQNGEGSPAKDRRSTTNPVSHYRAKFRKNRSIHYKNIAFFVIFQDGGCRPSWICLNILCLVLTTADSTWWSLSLCKIWLWSMQYSFDNINVSIFGMVGWKTPNRALEMGFWGFFDLLSEVQYQPMPKGTPLRESASFEPSSVKSQPAVWPVGDFLKKGV